MKSQFNHQSHHISQGSQLSQIKNATAISVQFGAVLNDEVLKKTKKKIMPTDTIHHSQMERNKETSNKDALSNDDDELSEHQIKEALKKKIVQLIQLEQQSLGI